MAYPIQHFDELTVANKPKQAPQRVEVTASKEMRQLTKALKQANRRKKKK